MSDETTLDTTGLLCPLPVLKLRKILKTLNKGARITMVADDPAALIDVPHFCAEAGHTLLETHENEGVLTFEIAAGG
ncbi:sulfurtransferase TusA family protein [Roseovarius sp. E0-M6]|uniref:sulfurtransferase TusA family protein n=1 Tax=Roseovarius sp. E0-M6 TaxID=3127118 RepID=UPI00300FCE2F